MNSQSHSNHSDGEELTLSQDSAGPVVYTITTQTVARQRFPDPFSIDQAAIQRQYNLSPVFCDYTETSHTDMTQGWAMLQQQSYPDSSNQAFGDSLQEKSAQQSFLPGVFQLPDTKSSTGTTSVTKEGDDRLNPNWRQDGVSDSRKERRKAQNRKAQRSFRARKDDSMKESSARVEALQTELTQIQGAYGILSDEVVGFQAEIAQLREENSNFRIESRYLASRGVADSDRGGSN